jgi:predicted transcriptional regulator
VARSNGDGTYMTIDGAHTLHAAIEAGPLEVPVEVIEADDYEARRQTYARNLSGTWHKVRLGRMWRDMMVLGSGRSGRDLARDLGVTEGTVRNMLLYVQADELRALRHDTRTEHDIAKMGVRRLREYIATLGVAGERDGAVTATSLEAVEEEPADLVALKRAWDKASEASRASFMAWPTIAGAMQSGDVSDDSRLRNSYAAAGSAVGLSINCAVVPPPEPTSIVVNEAVASAPAQLPLATRRRKKARLLYGITGKQLTALCKPAGTTVTAVAKELGSTPSNLLRHVNHKSAAPPKDAMRLAIGKLKKQASVLKSRSAKRTGQPLAKSIASRGPTQLRAAAFPVQASNDRAAAMEEDLEPSLPAG